MFIFLFCFLFYKDFVPSGKMTIVNDFKNKSQLVSDLYPDIRIRKIERDEAGEFYQTMFIDPVYFEIIPPRTFRKVKVVIRYKNENQSLFQYGVKRGKEGWAFDFRTLEFQKIDKLSWPKLQAGNLILLEKRKEYESIENFLLTPPTRGRIAQFNYSLETASPDDYLLTVLNTKTDLDHVSYIIANYTPPVVDEEIKTAKAEFDIDRSDLDEGKLVFMLSAPEMDINKNEIDIYELAVELEREPLRLRNAVRQVKEYLKDVLLNF